MWLLVLLCSIGLAWAEPAPTIAYRWHVEGTFHDTPFRGSAIVRGDTGTWEMDLALAGDQHMLIRGTWAPAEDGGLLFQSSYAPGSSMVLEKVPPAPCAFFDEAGRCRRGPQRQAWRVRKANAHATFSQIIDEDP